MSAPPRPPRHHSSGSGQAGDPCFQSWSRRVPNWVRSGKNEQLLDLGQPPFALIEIGFVLAKSTSLSYLALRPPPPIARRIKTYATLVAVWCWRNVHNGLAPPADATLACYTDQNRPSRTIRCGSRGSAAPLDGLAQTPRPTPTDPHPHLRLPAPARWRRPSPTSWDRTAMGPTNHAGSGTDGAFGFQQPRFPRSSFDPCQRNSTEVALRTYRGSRSHPHKLRQANPES